MIDERTGVVAKCKSQSWHPEFRPVLRRAFDECCPSKIPLPPGSLSRSLSRATALLRPSLGGTEPGVADMYGLERHGGEGDEQTGAASQPHLGHGGSVVCLRPLRSRSRRQRRLGHGWFWFLHAPSVVLVYVPPRLRCQRRRRRSAAGASARSQSISGETSLDDWRWCFFGYSPCLSPAACTSLQLPPPCNDNCIPPPKSTHRHLLLDGIGMCLRHHLACGRRQRKPVFHPATTCRSAPLDRPSAVGLLAACVRRRRSLLLYKRPHLTLNFPACLAPSKNNRPQGQMILAAGVLGAQRQRRGGCARVSCPGL